jgi:hypothetical protein
MQGRKSVFKIGGIFRKYVRKKPIFLIFLGWGVDSTGRSVSTFFSAVLLIYLKTLCKTSKSAWFSNQPFQFLAYFLCFYYFSPSKCLGDIFSNIGGDGTKLLGGMYTTHPPPPPGFAAMCICEMSNQCFYFACLIRCKIGPKPYFTHSSIYFWIL